MLRPYQRYDISDMVYHVMGLISDIYLQLAASEKTRKFP